MFEWALVILLNAPHGIPVVVTSEIDKHSATAKGIDVRGGPFVCGDHILAGIIQIFAQNSHTHNPQLLYASFGWSYD